MATIAGTIGKVGGAGVGLAVGGPAGAQIGGAVGQAVGEGVGIVASEFSPTAVAQRAEANKAATKLRTGEFGTSQAAKDSAYVQATKMLQAQSANQQANVARQQAAGVLPGGAYADAQRAIAQERASGMAQATGAIQDASNRTARSDYQNALALVDAEAKRGREFWSKEAPEGLDPTEAIMSGMGGGAVVGGPSAGMVNAFAV